MRGLGILIALALLGCGPRAIKTEKGWCIKDIAFQRQQMDENPNATWGWDPENRCMYVVSAGGGLVLQ